MSSKILKNLFRKNGILDFVLEPLIVSMLSCFSNENSVHNQNMICSEIVNTNFCKNYESFHLFFVSKIKTVESFKISNSDSVRFKIRNPSLLVEIFQNGVKRKLRQSLVLQERFYLSDRRDFRCYPKSNSKPFLDPKIPNLA